MGSISIGVAGLIGVACVPPTPVTPALPTGVGVQWLRDAGGAVDPGLGYQPAWERLSVLNGVVNGPDPATIEVYPPTYFAGLAFIIPLFPDGTAKYPWNGFAGEGVTDTVATVGIGQVHTVTGPHGSCAFASGPGSALGAIGAIVPSPDGSKVAVLSREPDAIMATPTTITLTGLVAGCPALGGASYRGSVGGTRGANGDKVTNPAVVWAPDSSAVLYGLTGPGGDMGRVVRLFTGAGSTPQVILDEGTDARVVPLGWSVGGRMLFSKSSSAAGPPSTVTTTVESVDLLLGWFRTVIDRFTGVRSFQGLHYGYVVPGTSIVVLNDASETRVNSTGETVPWFRVRLYDDASTGRAPLPGSDPPFAWHDEGWGQLPDAEMVERFTR